jgi:hypothetical protein
VVFLLGSSRLQVPNDIVNESKNHGDLIVEHFDENYHNLTLKSVLLLKYATHKLSSSKVKFVFKIDDDCFVFIQPFLKFVAELNPNR